MYMSQCPRAPWSDRDVHVERGIAGCGPGGYTGWVIREYPAARTPLLNGGMYSEAGPGSPTGWSGWYMLQCPGSVPQCALQPLPTLQARSVPMGPPW